MRASVGVSSCGLDGNLFPRLSTLINYHRGIGKNKWKIIKSKASLGNLQHSNSSTTIITKTTWFSAKASSVHRDARQYIFNNKSQPSRHRIPNSGIHPVNI